MIRTPTGELGAPRTIGAEPGDCHVYTYSVYCGHDERDQQERIIRYTDTYRRGKYRSIRVEKKIAEGPDAIAF